MATLLATIGILLGTLILIFGLLLLAPQVKVHAIKKNSSANWLFRVGGVLTILGLVFNVVSAANNALQEIGIVTGVCVLMGGIITWGHERQQAYDDGAIRWGWGSSLTLQMVIWGGLILLLSLIGK